MSGFEGEKEQEQEIGSIRGLSSSTKGPRKSLMIRRTLSADVMSSKESEWLSQFSPYKKMGLPGEFSSAAAAEEEEEEEENHEELKELEPERPSQFDIWSSIQSEKPINSSSSAQAPYIHPLVLKQRSASLLSEKSLDICTESLGSETGSDGFSSSDEVDHKSSTHKSDEEDEVHEGVELKHVRKAESGGPVNYKCSISRKPPPRSFPPPLPSLSRRDGPCLLMKPHREEGRLVLKAVPVPSHNYLHAQRQGDRLLLTLINPPPPPPPTPPTQLKHDQVEEDDNVDNEEEEEEEEGLLEKESQLEIKEEETRLDPEEEVDESEENASIDKKIVFEVEVSQGDIARELKKVNQLRIMLERIGGGGGGGGSTSLKILNLPEGIRSEEDQRDEWEKKVAAGVLPVKSFGNYEIWWRLLSSNNKTTFLEKVKDALVVTRCKDKDHPRPLFILETRCIVTS